ncbi:MAG TPA: tRNA lysidine(34) synthetase TilS [Anaerovoracaceae bacterium]|nr:tRNA lysidine(34) synthetase TilS [Anaerovoracaceae bacterium]
MNKVVQKILDSGLIEEKANIVLGLSGGPDSLCLFYALDSLAEEMNLNIYPVHLNHKFRPTACDEEQKRVEDLCLEKGWPCRSFVKDCIKIAEEEKIGSEEAGRNERYSAFAKVAKELKENGTNNIRIAVAQNANDQSETIMFRIVRGTAIGGLSGIKAERTDEYGNIIIRPLLNVTRKEIDDYIENLGVSPNVDKSNFEPVYNRNKIRLELFPYIEENINSGCQDALRRLGEIATLENDYMDEIVDKVLKDCVVNYDSSQDVLKAITLDTTKLIEHHKAIVFRAIDKIIYNMSLKDNVGRNVIKDIYDIINSDNPSARYDITKKHVARRKYNLIIFEKSEEAKKANMVKFKVSVLEKPEYIKDKAGCFAAFDYVKFLAEHGKTEGNIKFRNRQEGDYLPFKNGTKKLHDFFIDEKIPRESRDEVGLFAIGREILWIAPSEHFVKKDDEERGRFSQKYQIDNSTRLVLLLEIIG